MAVTPRQCLSLVAVGGQSRQSNIRQIDLCVSTHGLRIPEAIGRDRLASATALFLCEKRVYFLSGMLPTKVLATKGLASTCATWQELHW